MTDYDSQIRIPERPVVPHVLELDVRPFLAPPLRRSQRLMVLMNERLIGDFEVFRATRLFCDVPADAFRPQGHNMLRLLHPDATPVTAADPLAEDSRWMTFALLHLRLASE